MRLLFILNVILSFQVGGDWEALSIVKLKLTWERNYHGLVKISYYGKQGAKIGNRFSQQFLIPTKNFTQKTQNRDTL